MLEAITLDQMRTLVAAADEGSFSAAARKLDRAQSVVSQTISGLEVRLKVTLFEREGRYPILTEAGAALVNEARAVLRQADQFKARARDLASGVEPELSIALDVMFPIELFTAAVSDFETMFPDTALRVYVENLGAVIQPVLDRRCSLGDFKKRVPQDWREGRQLGLRVSEDGLRPYQRQRNSLRACSRLRTSRAAIVAWKSPFREKTTTASSMLGTSPHLHDIGHVPLRELQKRR